MADYGTQARNVIEAYAEGTVPFDKMIEVLKSMPWAETTPTGDWMASADIPVVDGPILDGVLGGAMALGYIDEDTADKIAAALG